MKLKVKTKLKGKINGAVGTITDMFTDLKGRTFYVVCWDNAKKGEKQTTETSIYLNWAMSKGALEVTR